jgi:DnaK suppressor protein
MARNEALLKLHSRLTSRRRELTGTIEEQLVLLRSEQGQTAGDELDVAAVSMNSELTSQLAEHESRELKSIERALHRLREGTYGNCEVCDKKIPIERLNILPYTTVCVTCQRELETNPELREELEQRHERELAGLGEEDDDQEFRSEEESEQPVADEPEEESRSARRKAALESAAKAGTKTSASAKAAAKVTSKGSVAAKPTVVTSKVPTKPAPPVKGAPAKLGPNKTSIKLIAAKPATKAESNKAPARGKPAPPAKATSSNKKITKPAPKPATKAAPAKSSAKVTKPASKTNGKSVTLSKAAVSRRTSAAKAPTKSAPKSKTKAKAGSRHR